MAVHKKALMATIIRPAAQGTHWARDGLRVNAAAPGYVRTVLVNRLVAGGSLDVGNIKQRTPMGRMAEPIAIARRQNSAGF